MNIIFLLALLVTTNIFASSSSHCHLVEGIYRNSLNPISNIQFETVVDVFTISNANQLSMNLDGSDLTFLRSSITIKKQVKMIYLLRKNGRAIRAAHIMIDRTPKEVLADREFYGNMIISEEVGAESNINSLLTGKNLIYNFYCQF